MDGSLSSSLFSSRGGDTSSAVQVALRIRPQGSREKLEGSRVCTSVVPGEPQVTIGADRSFTFDHVFDQSTQQVELYNFAVQKLVDGLFDGYNATVLAYGQTGSGKTYTMGTAFESTAVNEHEVGVIPRALAHVFCRVDELKREAQENGVLTPTFDVSVQFIELYNEEIIDLLAIDRVSQNVRIHEDSRGEIYLHGVTSKQVQDLHMTLEILKNGALNRTVAATNMNELSSRSHAIFSLHIKQQRVIPSSDEVPANQEVEMEILSAKFHFVDLAGSERLKRTGATGDRAREGISINCGLLALGNVISALGGASGKVSHIPYRDSKLTRLLQDSLGGNSRTLMVACVSPSDSDFVETLNTLKYANRAKNIKNKVVANQDKSSKLIAELRGRIAALEAELLEFKQGRRTIDSDGFESVNDQYHENVMLTAEVNQLRFRVKALQETNEILRNRNVDLLAKDIGRNGSAARTDHENEAEMLCDGEPSTSVSNDAVMDPAHAELRKYLEEMERLRSQFFEAQAVADHYRKESTKWKNQALGRNGGLNGNGESPFTSSGRQQLIEDARADIERLRRTVSAASNEVTSGYASHADTGEEDGTSNDADELDDDDDYDQDVDDDAVFDEEGRGAALRDNLADLQTEINIKERLIAELERSDRHLAEVRLTYEKKLTELSAKIKQMEAERDKFVMEAESKKTDKASEEKAKRIRDEYERKLTDMRNEFRKLQMVEKEHKRMQARQERERQELIRYQSELNELKRVKVDLMKKIKEEMKKAQQEHRNNAKRLAAMDKEARKRENLIRQLESKDRQREQFMKRTSEEISRLRKAQKEQARQLRPSATARMASLRTTPLRSPRTPGARGQPPPEIAFSPKQAKMKWTFIERKISRLVTQRQTVGKMEEELSRQLAERARLVNEITSLERRFVSTSEVDEREAVADEIDACQQKLKYVQDQIAETQTAIVDMDGPDKDADVENSDETTDLGGIEGVIEHCSNLIEAKYLMQHLFDACIEHAVAAAKADSQNKESEARIQQLEQQSFISEQLLSTVIGDKDLNDVEGMLERNSQKSSLPSTSIRNGSVSPSRADTSEPLPYRIRRHTASADELLYPADAVEPTNLKEHDRADEVEEKKEKKQKIDAKLLLPVSSSASTALERHSKFRMSLPARTLRGPGSRPPLPPLSQGKVSNWKRSSSRLPSLVEDSSVSEELAALREHAGTDSTRSTKSVFARLIPWTTDASPSTLLNRKQGRIVPVRLGSASQYRVVTRTATVEGHSKAVLSVATTEHLLLSGSKDRTAKLWDLQSGGEIRTLGVHPNNVHAVRFVPDSQLAITVSMYQVRVWDLRTQECLRMLQSSGQVNEGDGGPVGSRQNTVPFLETVVNAAEIDPSGQLLFTSFGGDVRFGIWKNGHRLEGLSEQ
ncbi:hypothetical protein KIN20_032150 [Parelaphostrongylus tenuis]|uniref:Kinesin motor domain-containing protein n=1 Tax=Parelaphostrongylus tenuis TaxID=148309 RepID=A0AAD5WHV0_PARTN|nr:hypothetical protein KIN20_032150 [Parelaphostrongylus tenuis]